MSFIAALVALLVGALILNAVGQSIEGRDSIFLHYGFVMLIVVVGGVLFRFGGGHPPLGFSALPPC